MLGNNQGQSSIVLAQTSVATSHTGDTTETTLATISLPANAMGANGLVEIFARFSFTGTAGAKTVKVKCGSTVLFTQSPTSTVTAIRVNAEMGNRNSASSQYVMAESLNSTPSSVLNPSAATIDTTTTQTITITGTVAAAADTVTLEACRARLLPKG